ncbi:MAG: transposase [Deltaproteobacteria bacterium]|nr:transposase [Deltaproteobacteria bacterium]
MARALRIAFPGACYHVTARGNERKAIFRDDHDRKQFLARLQAVVERYRVVVYAYVLMRNHYHLLVETPEGNLSEALRQLNAVYTQDFNRRSRRVGHLFQGRYKAILVDKESYLVELSRYIHLNPVRVGEVADPAQFRWSSAAAYVGRQPAASWLSVEGVLKQFGRRRSVAQRAYRQFLRDGVGQGRAAPWDAVVGQTLLGEVGWVERMRQRVSKRGMGLEVAHGAQLRARPALSVVVTQVVRATKVPRQEIVRRGGGWARALAMWLVWELCGLRQREVGAAFGVGHFAVSKAIRRAQRLQQSNRQVAKVASRLITTFQA